MKCLCCIFFVLSAFGARAQDNKDSTSAFHFYNSNTAFHTKAGAEKPNAGNIPVHYGTRQMPFFWQEKRLEKIATIPILIRIGSVSDCNYLEQKPGYSIR